MIENWSSIVINLSAGGTVNAGEPVSMQAWTVNASEPLALPEASAYTVLAAV